MSQPKNTGVGMWWKYPTVTGTTGPTARFIGGAWHSFDCMCPVCLQATMDEINGELKTMEVKGCECGATKVGASAHSAWCPLYTAPPAV